MIGETGKTVARRRWVRPFVLMTAAFLWVAVLALGLELGARLVQRYRDVRNPLIAFRNGLPCEERAIAPFLALRQKASPDLARPVPSCGMLEVEAGMLRVSRAARECAARNASSAPLRVVPGESRRGVLEKFPAMSEPERRAFALLRGEMILSLNGAGRLVNTYGEEQSRRSLEELFATWSGMFVRKVMQRGLMERINQACREAAAGQAGFVELSDSEGIPILALRAGAGREAVYVFFGDGAPPGPDNEPVALPPDSPWERPWFRYKPHLKDARGAMGSRISTNNRGYVDIDFEAPKPAGVFRILCIGGSTTEEGPTLETSYPNRLEEMLQKLAPQSRVEVFNCGIAGMTTHKQLEKLDEYLAYQPDLAVVCEGINDLFGAIPAYWEEAPDTCWRNAARRSCFLRMALPSLLLPPASALRRDVVRRVVDRLDAFSRVLMSSGIPVALCTIPIPPKEAVTPVERAFYDFDARSHWDHPWLSYTGCAGLVDTLNRETARWCDGQGVCLIPLDACYNDGYAIFNDLCHMQPAGVERKARAVLQALVPAPNPAPQ